MIEKKELDYAKEAGDVVKLLVAIAEHFKMGKSVAESYDLLDEVMAALKGMDQIDDEYEVSKSAVLGTILYETSALVEILSRKLPDTE